ncbi:hypothetical protein [Ciceribacter sp. RN22]|uniref:hypothetical protein n=1 Tax=Ciceribacter sp. RN22 TaxID=2954932 RepID=UPI00209355E0|nr:hypothetical protein [Ciceribacter sp. RN22]MCO6179440.1 hypothetical protein [Ciceribacter sp. RN22]
MIGVLTGSDVIAGGTHFEHGLVPREIVAKVEKIKALHTEYNVPIKAAALLFLPRANRGGRDHSRASKPDRILENHAALNAKEPADFWHGLRSQGLVAMDAPFPSIRRNAIHICYQPNALRSHSS